MSLPTENNSTSQPSALDNIKHVIVLMFENRSFDHLLGAMPGVNGVLDGNGKVNQQELYNTLKPLEKQSKTNVPTYPTEIIPGKNPIQPSSSLPSPNSLPSPPYYEQDCIIYDFNHNFGSGMIQDLYGPGTTGVENGKPQNNPKTTYPSSNSGFLEVMNQRILKDKGDTTVDFSVMSYFQWGSMQVFHTLAKNFVVCDAWHCDMPGHTVPNRAFMHCATVGDLGIDDNDAHSQDGQYEQKKHNMVNRKTIFEQIQENKQTWKMYWPGGNCDTDWLNTQVFSQQYKATNPTQNNVTQVPIATFFTDASKGSLPFYSFIMCWNSVLNGGDTSMHPAHGVEYGENFLACIYNALRASPCWENTLLIVNFDENGGIYDHNPIPPVSRPGDITPPVQHWKGKDGKEYSFDFSVLGLRIPVLLISPWLNAGVCSTQYQNTSILSFLQGKNFLPNANPNYLTERDKNAPSIAPVFDYSNFGSNTLRANCPENIKGQGNGYGDSFQILNTELPADTSPKDGESDEGGSDQREDLAAKPLPHIADMTREYLAALPGHADSGKTITRDFATVGEMLAYAKERRDAALTYIKAKQSQE
ncbi:MAG: alkaline phosphatase family protein [Blastocatellia bacterium]